MFDCMAIPGCPQNDSDWWSQVVTQMMGNPRLPPEWFLVVPGCPKMILVSNPTLPPKWFNLVVPGCYKLICVIHLAQLSLRNFALLLSPGNWAQVFFCNIGSNEHVGRYQCICLSQHFSHANSRIITGLATSEPHLKNTTNGRCQR